VRRAVEEVLGNNWQAGADGFIWWTEVEE
jgi:hypothetical protein